MKRRIPGPSTAFLVLLLAVGQGRADEEQDRKAAEFFETKIRPVLSGRCYGCHSTKSEKVKGGLLLDSRDGILRGGASGPVVLPGKPEESPLILAVRRIDEDKGMPPRAKDHLTPAQIADFEAWIVMGAPVPVKEDSSAPPKKEIDFEEARKFWSFRPVEDPPVPAVRDAEWPRGPIDRFILSRLEAKGIRPVEDAGRRTWIRRATFDLIGLPPTPEEVDAFLSDASPDATETVVERLLASPHYGERWGRHWLDLARYSDTAGDSADYPIPQAHRYRDYVIDAFNKDKPYDRFVREQIAGDLLPAESEEDRYEKIIATGFVAVARRFGEDPRLEHPLTLDDTLETFGRSLLGMTLGCAKCHDHKFDPIPTEDYYALYGIFKSTQFPYPGSTRQHYHSEFVPLLPREEAGRRLRPHRERMAALDARLRPLEREIKELEKGLGGKPGPGARRKPRKSLQELRKEAGALRKQRETLARKRPVLPEAYAVSEGKAEDARVHIAGSPEKPGAVVPRGFLRILGGPRLSAGAAGSGRRELAGWLTDSANPLTARVMVNRIWQHHFGKGIVPTPSYFGKQGLPPTHPRLLDHLAARFVESGWSVKAMHRLIMRSRTYRLASRRDPENERVDPGNDLLWRARRRRLEGEAIRDAMLAVSGTLDRRAGGVHPFPAEKTWKFSKSQPFRDVYPTRRRSVYLMQQRLDKHPFLALFDGADANAETAVRFVSTTSVQALFMMNDPFVHKQAKAFGGRIRRSAAGDRERLDLAHRLAFGRPATSAELRRGKAYLHAFGEAEDAAWTSLARVLLAGNEFIYVD